MTHVLPGLPIAYERVLPNMSHELDTCSDARLAMSFTDLAFIWLTDIYYYILGEVAIMSVLPVEKNRWNSVEPATWASGRAGFVSFGLRILPCLIAATCFFQQKSNGSISLAFATTAVL